MAGMERPTATALVLSYLAASAIGCNKESPAPVTATPSAETSTRAADGLLARARDTELQELAAFYERLAHDEARHAALAFETALWLASTFLEARRALDHAMMRHDQSASGADRARMKPLLALLARDAHE